MKKTLILTILLLFFGTVVNSFSTTLKKIDTVGLSEQLKLYFVFDTTPQFTTNLSGTKLSLTFKNTEAVGDIKLPETNQDVIRYSLDRRENETTISIFFRYVPDDFKAQKASNSEISLTATIGNIYSNSYRSLAQKLQGLKKVSNTELRYLSPLASSVYRNNWENFFDLYQPKYEITFPVQLTWPPFPLINYLSPNFTINSTLLSPELLEAGKNERWNELKIALPELIKGNKNVEEQQLLTFVYAEALARSNNYEDSYRQASVLDREFPNTQLATLCRYLMALLHAKYIDPYLPKVEFDQIFKHFKTTNPIKPYIQVNKIEVALATGNLELMNSLLIEDNLGFPINLAHTLSLRQADYWHALQQPIKAAAAYRIAGKDAQIPTLPYSRNGHCSSLFLQHKFNEATTCYNDLKDFTESRENLSLVNYMAAFSKGLSQNSKVNNAQDFYNLGASFSGTKGGQLSDIKTLDIQARKKSSDKQRLSIAKRYLNIAHQGIDRDIREEASIKAALSYYLGKDYKSAIDTLFEMRKEIRTGPLHNTSLALLIEILPYQVELLYEKKKYKELILLIQHNRELLINGWLKAKTTLKVAQSYYKLGLDEEAFSIFSYIISSEQLTSSDAADLYLPLLRSGYSLNKFSQVIDFASEFQHLYPQAEQKSEIDLIKCMALFALGQEDKALTGLPETEDGKRFALQIFYYQKKFQTVVTKAKNLDLTTSSDLFFVAESHFQTGRLDLAQPFYEKVDINSSHWAQSQYRLAEYYTSRNQTEKAQEITSNLLSKEPNSVWTNLSQKNPNL